MSARDDVLEVIDELAGTDGLDADLSARIDRIRTRLGEPLRVALTGMVKAGKSTLLNALVGDEIAPTDTGECTTVVTWYRFGRRPRIELHPRVGAPRELPVRRVEGRLVLDLGGADADEVDHLVVEWPSQRLRDLVLIDTPGTGSPTAELSGRAAETMTSDAAVPAADAVIYLLRHLRALDVEFLHAFRNASPESERTAAAIVVLSRADEAGSGRIDALVSARDLATRYRVDPALTGLALDVLPVAGLLAQASRTLREAEFRALKEFAGLGPDERRLLLISSDRFLAGTDALQSAPEVRARLLGRLGVFGVRLAAAVLRGAAVAAGPDGAGLDATGLAAELARRSGIDALTAALRTQFVGRADWLRARSALAELEPLLEDDAFADTDLDRVALLDRLVGIRARARDAEELTGLALLAAEAAELSADEQRDARRLLGGQGPDGKTRFPGDADELAALLATWRAEAEDPLVSPETARVGRAVVRTAEALILAGSPSASDASRSAADGSVAPLVAHLALAPQPAADRG